MQLRLSLLALVLAACSACGDDGDTPTDAPIVVDIDNGSCGNQLRFTGEYVDWDSSDATFCGIFDALFEVPPDGAMDSTAPNGRFDMCIDGNAAVTLVNVTPPAGASACTTPASTYSLAGVAVANAAMLRAGGTWSGRNFTADRLATIGFVPDAAKGHLFVHIDGSRTIAITGNHGAAQAMVDTTWAAGDTGHEVVFPNVDPGTVTITATGGSVVGAGDVAVTANTITYVSLKAL